MAASRPRTREIPKKAIAILQTVLATEIVCVLRYTMHAVAAAGISSDGVKDEFNEHAKEVANINLLKQLVADAEREQPSL